jgi:hypothetical protein
MSAPASAAAPTNVAAEETIKKSLQSILESQKAMLKTIFPTSDEEPNPEYEEAVKKLAEALGIQAGGYLATKRRVSRKVSRRNRKRNSRKN